MTSIKDKLLCLTPLTIGLCCLVQGLLLVSSPNSLTQLLGIGLFLWMPGCGYYAWKGRRALWTREAAAPARHSHVSAPAYAEVCD